MQWPFKFPVVDFQIHTNEISWMTRKQLKKHKRKSIRAMLDRHQMKTRTSAARLERERR